MKLLLEGIWWFVTAIIVSLVMYPIWSNFPEFKFNVVNIVNITAFVTFTRYIFLLKYTFIAKMEKVKIGFVLFTLMIVIAITTQIQSFNVWIDGGDPDVLLSSVGKSSVRESLLNYIKSEFLFFVIAAIVSAIVLAGRLMVSVWSVRNRSGQV